MSSFKRFWGEESLNECFDDCINVVVTYQKVRYPHTGYSSIVETLIGEAFKRSCEPVFLVSSATFEDASNNAAYLGAMYPEITAVPCTDFAGGLEELKTNNKTPATLVVRLTDVNEDTRTLPFVMQVTEAYNRLVGQKQEFAFDETPPSVVNLYDQLVKQAIDAGDSAKISAITGLDSQSAEMYIQYYG